MNKRLRKSDDIFVVSFVTRNKDNQDIPDFKESRETFLVTEYDDRVSAKFEEFKRRHAGDFCRAYMSVNPRSQAKLSKSLQHYLIDNPDINFAAMDSILSSLGMDKALANSHRILLDVDTPDDRIVVEIINDLVDRGLTLGEIQRDQTVNGWSLVLEHGVDMRGLIDRQPDEKLANKRDQGPWKWSPMLVSYKGDGFKLVGYGFRVN